MKSFRNLFSCNLDSYYSIRTQLCSWCDSSAVVTCAKLGLQLIIIIDIGATWICTRLNCELISTCDMGTRTFIGRLLTIPGHFLLHLFIQSSMRSFGCHHRDYLLRGSNAIVVYWVSLQHDLMLEHEDAMIWRDFPQYWTLRAEYMC